MSSATPQIEEYEAATKARRDGLETKLRQAWLDYVLGYEDGRYNADHGLMAIAREVESWAADSDPQNLIERYEMVSIISDAAVEVGRRE